MSMRNVTRLEATPQPLSNALVVKPISPVIGAEIEGVDLENLDDATFEAIRKASLDHHVLVFRNQMISLAAHKAFARRFGVLHTHPWNRSDPKSDPEILEIKADANSAHVNGEDWHTDVSCDERPPMGSMLLLKTTPEGGAGGDTMFASTVAAYDTLSEPMKAFLGGLTAVHEGHKLYTDRYEMTPPPGGWPKAVHPVITTVPETGRKVLFVNRFFTTRIVELDRHESDAVLEMLWRHIESTMELQCRIRWEPNTLVFWDNRATQHRAVWDYFPKARNGQRVSIIGERLIART